VSGTTKCLEQSTTNDAIMMNTNSTRQLTNENCGSKGYGTAGSVQFVFGFFGGASYKDKN
jgi:hypothetical protein